MGFTIGEQDYKRSSNDFGLKPNGRKYGLEDFVDRWVILSFGQGNVVGVLSDLDDKAAYLLPYQKVDYSDGTPAYDLEREGLPYSVRDILFKATEKLVKVVWRSFANI